MPERATIEQKIEDLGKHAKAAKQGVDDLVEKFGGDEGVKALVDNVDKLGKAVGQIEEDVQKISVTGGRLRVDDEKTGGYKHYGEFALDVVAACRKTGPVISERLEALQERAGATSPATTVEGEAGGFINPEAFSEQIWQLAVDGGDILGRMASAGVETDMAGGKVPMDETTPWGSDGIQAYWDDESDQATQSRPKVKKRSWELHKLRVLAPATDEQLQDARLTGSLLQQGAARAINWKASDAIVNGTGAGQPQGYMNAACLVSVAKKSGQSADTIVAENVTRMWARVPGYFKVGAFWSINDDATWQLPLMTLGDQPTFLPTGRLNEEPGGMLHGAPVVPNQHQETLGDQGDIVLVAPRGYRVMTRRGGIQASQSMHLWFDYDQTAFKFVFRMDGYPLLTSAITPNKGTDDLSAFATVDART